MHQMSTRRCTSSPRALTALGTFADGQPTSSEQGARALAHVNQIAMEQKAARRPDLTQRRTREVRD